MTIESDSKAIADHLRAYEADIEKFLKDGNAAAARRSRKSLGEIAKLCKSTRAAISDRVNSGKTSGGCCATPVAGGRKKTAKK